MPNNPAFWNLSYFRKPQNLYLLGSYFSLASTMHGNTGLFLRESSFSSKDSIDGQDQINLKVPKVKWTIAFLRKKS